MQANDSVLDAKVNMLVGLGFSPNSARVALEASNGNVDDALDFLVAPGGQLKEKKTGVSSHGRGKNAPATSDDEKMQPRHSKKNRSSGPGPELSPNQVNPSRSRTSEKKKGGTGTSHHHRSHGHSGSHSSGDSRRHHPAPPAQQSFPGAYSEYGQYDPGDEFDEYDVEATRFNRDTNVLDNSSASNTDPEEELIEAYVVRDDHHQQAPQPYYYDQEQRAPPPFVPCAPTAVAQPETPPEKPKEPQDANRNINNGGPSGSANAQALSSLGRNHGDDCWLITTNRYSLIGCGVIWLVIIICFVVTGLTAKSTDRKSVV